ncbi:MAG: PEP-CTERM sorting domain-containing protein, partial [Terrimicrobiaceae bacterium]
MKNHFLIIGLTLGLAAIAHSATVGVENGGQYTAGTWINGAAGNISNWYITTGIGANSTIGDSSLNGRAGIGPTNAFYIVGNSPNQTFLDVYKPLGGALLVGQSVVVDANYLWNGGIRGVELQTGAGPTNLFRFEQSDSDPIYLKIGAVDTQVVANAYQQALTYTVTALSLTSVQVKATLFGSAVALVDQTVAVSALPDQLHFYAKGSTDSNAANFDNYGMFFNNLEVTAVPEPSTFALLGLGLAVV